MFGNCRLSSSLVTGRLAFNWRISLLNRRRKIIYFNFIISVIYLHLWFPECINCFKITNNTGWAPHTAPIPPLHIYSWQQEFYSSFIQYCVLHPSPITSFRIYYLCIRNRYRSNVNFKLIVGSTTQTVLHLQLCVYSSYGLLVKNLYTIFQPYFFTQ